MQLRLKWNNPNQLTNEVSIYRSDAIVPVADLGAALVTLPGTTIEWTDDTVVRDATYYYYWKTFAGGDTVWSAPFKVLVKPYSGPGPETLIYGSLELGYCGDVGWKDLFTATEIGELTGLSMSVTSNPLVVWSKFVRNGKYLFTPQTFLGGITFSSLYKAGVMFGVEGPGPWKPTGAADKNQMTVISKGIHKFIVRLPTGADDRNNPTRVVPDNAPVTVRRYSELSDIVYPIYNTVVPSQRLPSLIGVAISTSVSPGYSRSATQESYKGGFLTGVTYSSDSANLGLSQDALASVAYNQSVSYLPILELIPTQTLEVQL